jgi:hypothetical protein
VPLALPPTTSNPSFRGVLEASRQFLSVRPTLFSPTRSFSLTRGSGHPFDLTKTRLQTAPAGAYKGAVDVVKQALARDGALGCVVLAAHTHISNRQASTDFTVVSFPRFSV